MKAIHTLGGRDPSGGKTPAGNHRQDATDDAAHLDSAADGTARPEPAGKRRGGEDGVSAVLAILVADHPEAVFYAIEANASTVAMPQSVDLNEHVVIEGHRTALDMVIPAHRGIVIDTWEKVAKTGIASAHVRLAADPGRRVMLHYLDARAEHGVFIGAITGCELADKAAIAHRTPARTPRLASARKDGLANLLEIDDAFTQILGWTADEVLGRRTRDLIHPDDEALAVDNWMDMLASPGPGRRVRLRHRHRDGSWVWIEVTNHNLLDDSEHGCVVADMLDVSEEMAITEALRAREQLLERLAETLPLGLLQIDSASRVVYTNDRLHAILGVPEASTVEEQVSTVVEEDRHVIVEAFANVLASGLDGDIEVRVRPITARGQELRHCTFNLRSLSDASGTVNGAIVCVTDVTKSVRAREELRTRATYDALTHSYNRTSVMAELEVMLSSNGTDQRPAVIFVDLDHFKDVNDAFGHSAGDEFLRVVAERLHQGVRAGDIVGRIGGDEFLVICPRMSAAAEAMSTAARLADSLHRKVRLRSGHLPSSASIGVAWTPDDTTAETLVAQADTAMYVCKRAGNGKPVVFDESMLSGQDEGPWQWPALPDE